MDYPGKYLPGSVRQLMDLTVKPSAHMGRLPDGSSGMIGDERPMFDLGEVPPNYPGKGLPAPWRVLRWHPVNGTEVCATTPEQLADYERQGYVSFPPQQQPANAVESLKAELDALSPDDRAVVIEMQRQARMSALQAKLAALSEADLSSIAEEVPVKRGPGRPRKTDVA